MPDDVPGWYGKIASLGDFAQRRMSAEWVNTCDAWLSRGIQASRARLGPRWLEVYLTAPLLRFAWTPGVIDANWWFGVLMPSCDAVGRYFPLLVALSRAQAPADGIALDHLGRWYEQLAQAALHTLHEHSPLEEFETLLAGLPPWPPASPPAANVSLADQVQSMAGRELLQRLARCSLWWHAGSPMRVLPGLPEAEAFVDLLDVTAAAA